MLILGLSAYYHDSAAALSRDGVIIAAAQEERFTRKKHDSSFPLQAVTWCLEFSGLDWNEIDEVVFYDKPLLKFERLLETYLAYAPRGFKSFRAALPVWLKEKVFLEKNICVALNSLGRKSNKKILFCEHHLSHAASAFFPSPFDNAVILTLDGVGEWITTSVCIGRKNKIEFVKDINFPHSLGLLYSAFTYYLGFKVNSGEYKLMGLAPYGTPRYIDLIKKNLIDIKDDGSFRLDMSYFDYCTGLTMTNRRFERLFGHPVRKPEETLRQFHMDAAASIQSVLEECILLLTQDLAAEYKLKNLCMAGGVALNCVANGKMLRSGNFENIWIQPASGDAGGAVGAALSACYIYHSMEREPSDGSSRDGMSGSYLGPEWSNAAIKRELSDLGAIFGEFEIDDLLQRAAALLADSSVVGWFQGRMEFGPRALGNRSILANPKSPDMQKKLNLKIKFRESFRPFAPAVLAEKANEWFNISESSPYMLFVADVQKNKQLDLSKERRVHLGLDQINQVRSEIPAVTHVDYSARIQTVHADTNARFYGLIEKFELLTGCPMLVNTSFNIRGEPIVNSVGDAFKCFMGTDMDALVIGNFVLIKNKQNPDLAVNYQQHFALD